MLISLIVGYIVFFYVLSLILSLLYGVFILLVALFTSLRHNSPSGS